VISTVKHFALNANELNRQQLDARIDRSAMRDSDLLAFEIAIERGHPGSVMCAYNKVNGEYACGNHWLLTDVLKQDWHYPGWVMSDWGAVHDVNYAAAGLDQESGEQLDKAVFFAAPLRQAVDSDAISKARLDDMVHRILRSMFDVGVVDHPPVKMVIGGHANLGVLSGGGSAQVIPSNGAVVRIPIGGGGVMANFGGELFDPSAPYDAIHALAPDSVLRFDAGDFPARAADAAAKSDVAIVFVTRHELEGSDVPDLTLPDGQDAMIAAVAKANPRTIVVLETGNPVAMPWLSSVAAVLASWYPGQEGGQAIADLLFGAANPSGRLPLTFPRAESDLVRPSLPNFGAAAGAQVHVDYTEGATVGYRGYGERAPPLDPRLLGSFDEERRRWIVRHGVYRVRVAHSAQDLGEGGEATVAGGPWAQGATS
jgi:beta-glucosidase